MRGSFLVLAVAGCAFKPATGQSSNNPDATTDGASLPPGWWSSEFHARRQLTVDNSTVAQALTRFPVCVAMTQAENAGALGANSSDVRFIAADNTTVLPYDVDTGSAAGATFWVLLDVPDMTKPRPTFWMYFADAGSAGPSPDPHAVWVDYVSVHHLGGDFHDVTGNGHDGTTTPPTTPTTVAGRIGDGAMFDGSASEVPLTTTSQYDLATSLSVSVWVNLAQWKSEFECVVCKGDSAWRMHRGMLDSKPSFGFTPASNGTLGNTNLDGSTNVDDGQWHQVAIQYDGTSSQMEVYVDGGAPTTMAEGMLATNTQAVVIGRNAEAVNPANRYFDGVIDELRIGSAIRGSAWFATEVRTASDPTFVTLGSAQTIP
jgi:hypothetical protein